ncbi:unnamed protein product [Rotaria sp. Silwood2]|nr:unnamed protein product [Rotaria sp. Silwood2]
MRLSIIGSKTRTLSNRQYVPPSVLSNDTLNRLSTISSRDEGCRLLSEVSSEENKLLQYLKEILEERVLLDKQYAQNLQELAAKADRIACLTKTNSMASICHKHLMQWSQRATAIDSSVDQFRCDVLDILLQNLLEQKNDLKKFFEDEKRQYEVEHQKAQNNVTEAEKHYSNAAKTYVAKNNELTKFTASAKIGDDNRITEMKRSVMENQDNVYRAHNEYVLALRNYNFIDEHYIHKISNLVTYHQETQIFLNQSWQNLLEAIANYMNIDSGTSYVNINSSGKLSYIEPQHSYDEMCKIYSKSVLYHLFILVKRNYLNSTLLMTKNPIIFNDTLLQTSGLSDLKANQIIIDESVINDSTIGGLKEKIQMLTNDLNEDNNELVNVLRIIDQIKDTDIAYYGRKSLFQQNQQAENLRMRIAWKENLRNDLHDVFEDAGLKYDDSLDAELPAGLSDRLEGQTYFHGLIPRVQSVSLLNEKGDYLVRINNQNKIVLSILWPDKNDPTKLKDSHFFINEKDNMYSLQENGITKPTVPKLITFYTRHKLELSNDGTRLIRPVEKPDYIIDNHEIKKFQKLGQGHFGEVFRGEYRNTPIAVKILRSTIADRSSKDQEMFINEALLLKRYKHKRIVNFIGVAAHCEPLMIVMEFVEKGSLSDYLKNNELRVSQLIQMCNEIAKGMAYLESNHVIHRDLAARNCLVDKNGRVKVGDFGLSRCLHEDEEYFSHIKEFPVRWWAVEVLSNGPYTHKSDVWSYGITIWEVFSKAALPYAHLQHNHLVIDAVKRGERLKQPQKCPVNIYAIMTNCWLLDAKDRYNFEKIVELLKKEKSVLPKIPFFGSSK